MEVSAKLLVSVRLSVNETVGLLEREKLLVALMLVVPLGMREGVSLAVPDSETASEGDTLKEGEELEITVTVADNVIVGQLEMEKEREVETVPVAVMLVEALGEGEGEME